MERWWVTQCSDQLRQVAGASGALLEIGPRARGALSLIFVETPATLGLEAGRWRQL